MPHLRVSRSTYDRDGGVEREGNCRFLWDDHSKERKWWVWEREKSKWKGEREKNRRNRKEREMKLEKEVHQLFGRKRDRKREKLQQMLGKAKERPLLETVINELSAGNHNNNICEVRCFSAPLSAVFRGEEKTRTRSISSFPSSREEVVLCTEIELGNEEKIYYYTRRISRRRRRHCHCVRPWKRRFVTCLHFQFYGSLPTITCLSLPLSSFLLTITYPGRVSRLI